MPEGETV